jgi:hypothetical protein
MTSSTLAELPGDVLISLRRSEGFGSVNQFADTLPMSSDTLRRLEMVVWGTTEDQWERPVERRDIKALKTAGWIKKGDNWWERFRTALAWQDVVIRFGDRVYAKEGFNPKVLAPVSQEHVILLATAVVERELHRWTEQGGRISEEQRPLLVERMVGEVLFRLSTTGLALAQGVSATVIPVSEQTRALQSVLAADTQTENPYVHTLRLAYDWAEQAIGEALSQMG